MSELRRYMIYKRLPDIEFPWSYDELLDLPLFMKDHVYKVLDEFIEDEKLKRNNLQVR